MYRFGRAQKQQRRQKLNEVDPNQPRLVAGRLNAGSGNFGFLGTTAHGPAVNPPSIFNICGNYAPVTNTNNYDASNGGNIGDDNSRRTSSINGGGSHPIAKKAKKVHHHHDAGPVYIDRVQGDGNEEIL